jgi:3-oxoacyl-[acyl-carrier protein] reductase
MAAVSAHASAPYDLTGHVALVTGANHGIGAATARMLAECGAGVLLSYLSEEPEDAGTSDASRHQRSASADAVLSEIQASGGKGSAVEADLRDPEIAVSLFDAAERSVGPVDILVNNASGWVADTFELREFDRLGRSLLPLSASSFDQVFGVDARGAALLIAPNSPSAMFDETRRGAGSLASRPAGRTGSPEKCLTEQQKQPRRISRCPQRSNSPVVA